MWVSVERQTDSTGQRCGSRQGALLRTRREQERWLSGRCAGRAKTGGANQAGTEGNEQVGRACFRGDEGASTVRRAKTSQVDMTLAGIGHNGGVRAREGD